MLWQSSFGIIHNQLLAESVDEVLRAPGDDKLVGCFDVNFTVSPIR